MVTILVLFEGTRAIDWVMLFIEGLVLILIAYEVIVERNRHNEEQRRRRAIAQQVSELSRLMDKGQRIRSNVPDPSFNNAQEVKLWKEAVEAWTAETNSYLSGRSTAASSAFMLVTEAGTMDSVVISSGRQFALFGEFREFYQQFVVRIANLRRILEQAEIYF